MGGTPAGDQTELTGRTWEEFAVEDPEVAYLFSRQPEIPRPPRRRVWPTGRARFGHPLPPRRAPGAWYALWVFPITIGAVAARMLVDQYSAGYYYGGLTAVAVAGLLLPIRAFLRTRD